MKAADTIDTARIDLPLGKLCLAGINLIWPGGDRRQGRLACCPLLWLLLIEQDVMERDRRRFECHLAEARRPSRKTLEALDFAVWPAPFSRSQG